MINYYVEKNGIIEAFDIDLNKLKNSYYGQNVEILQTERPIVDFVFADTDEYIQEQAQKERERINLLNMTKADFWIALLDKNITKQDVLEKINLIENDTLRAKARIQLEDANNYWRGNEFMDLIGNMFGITSDELDYLFKAANGENIKGIDNEYINKVS